MWILIFFLLFCSYLTSGAQNNRSQYKPYQDKADSIVGLFLGQNAFENSVRLDSGKSLYRITEINRTQETNFTNRLTYKPTSFVFHYDFTHPHLYDEIFPVVFALDSSGRLMVGKETQGLITALDFDDAKIVTRKQALKVCQSQAKSIKKNSAALIWYNATVDYERYAQSHDLSSIWCGRMMWRIEGRIKFRGDFYDGAFYVDVLNGQVARAFAVPWD